jgi:hypothetical protein
LLNPTTFGFQHSGKNVDGSTFTAAEYGHTAISVDGKAPITLALPFSATGQYQFPASALGTLATGSHTWAAQIVGSNGNASALSPAFSFDIDTSTPSAPFGLTAS